MSQMEPAIRAYLTKMRDEAFIDIKPGYVDTGASPDETKPIFSAYVPPAPKKKAKVERTRFRESTRTFRQKSARLRAGAEQAAARRGEEARRQEGRSGHGEAGQEGKDSLWAGSARDTACCSDESAHGERRCAAGDGPNAEQPANPLEPTRPTQKTRFSARARTEKKTKTAAARRRTRLAPAPPDAAEVADRQTQSAPLGLSGQTPTNKKKKAAATTAEKTRLSQEEETGRIGSEAGAAAHAHSACAGSAGAGRAAGGASTTVPTQRLSK